MINANYSFLLFRTRQYRNTVYHQPSTSNLLNFICYLCHDLENPGHLIFLLYLSNTFPKFRIHPVVIFHCFTQASIDCRQASSERLLFSHALELYPMTSGVAHDYKR